MPSQQGPGRGLTQLNVAAPSRTRARLAGVAVSLALAGAALGAGSAVAQSGAPTAPPATTTTPAPAPSSGGWTIVQNATWYGPGFWGHSTACGVVLTKTVVGVANKNLPCGTLVTFSYNGRSVPATVIDRGPYRKGYAWDLTKKLAKRLGFLPVGAGPVQATVQLPPP
jgi:rare lipoprotein A